MRLAPFASSRSVPLGMVLVLSLLSFLIGVALTGLRHLPLFALQPNLVWGLLLVGLSLSLPYAWRRCKATLLDRTSESPFTTVKATLPRLSGGTGRPHDPEYTAGSGGRAVCLVSATGPRPGRV
jgi:hypothetical protein